MDKKNGTRWTNPVIVLVGLTATATLATAMLALFGQYVVAAIIGTATVFFWLALIVVSTAAIVSWWSATLMQRGAEIALTAQVSDDKRDGILIGQVGNLTRDVLRLVKDEKGEPQQPPIPARWLPKYDALPSPETDEGIN